MQKYLLAIISSFRFYRHTPVVGTGSSREGIQRHRHYKQTSTNGRRLYRLATSPHRNFRSRKRSTGYGPRPLQVGGRRHPKYLQFVPLTSISLTSSQSITAPSAKPPWPTKSAGRPAWENTSNGATDTTVFSARIGLQDAVPVRRPMSSMRNAIEKLRRYWRKSKSTRPKKMLLRPRPHQGCPGHPLPSEP
jgi:hypothetical protein